MKVVLKISGKGIDFDDSLILEPVAELFKKGVQVALVHGGGVQISSFMEKMHRKPVFVDGLRVTTEEDMDITEMVLSGLVNKRLVGGFSQLGVNACGISGRDGNLFVAKKVQREKDGKLLDLGRVGEIVEVNTRIIETLWQGGFLPVISPVSTDESGNSLNVNADWAACRLAQALGVEELFLFSDVPGVLRMVEDPFSLCEELSIAEAETLIREGVIQGGMIPKVEMACRVVCGGVNRVFIGSLGELRKACDLERGNLRGTWIKK
jgi:acetylglutamate kinase